MAANRATIHDLPQSLLGDVLARAPFVQRHGSLARVCRAWRQLVLSPQLLRRVEVHLQFRDPCLYDYGTDGSWVLDQEHDPAASLLCSLTFFPWLEAHAAPHVEQLTIRTRRLVFDIDDYEESLEVVARRLRDSLGRCDVLTHLTIALRQGPLHFHASDLAAAPRLRSLSLTISDLEHPDSSGLLEVDGLLALTALESLTLVGAALDLGGTSLAPKWQSWARPRGPKPHDGLPPSLTSLALDGYADFKSSVRRFLPQQLTALSSLRRLALGNVAADSPAAYIVLSRVSSLEELTLFRCSHLPTCLPQLSSLHALRLDSTPRGLAFPDEAAGALEQLAAGLQALGPLAHLTHLSLEGMPELPPTITGLTQLRALYWGAERPREPRLPAGPWTAGLQQLALSCHVAANSLAVLSAATRLECLAVFGSSSYENKDAAAELQVAAWAAKHPGLRRLAVSNGNSCERREHLDAGLAQLRLPPTLSIEQGSALLAQLQNV